MTETKANRSDDDWFAN